MNRFNSLSWGPWAELGQLASELNRLMGAFDAPTSRDAPRISVWSGNDGAVVTAQMPGVTVDDIDIMVHDSTLTLSCKRPEPKAETGQSIAHSELRFGSFSRQVSLPFSPNPEEVEAKYNGGVLEIRLPRAAGDKPRRIQVNVSH
jgi:HSP20 family protein